MDWLIIIGAIISVIGLGGLVMTAFKVWSARRSGLDDEALRAVIAKAIPLNLGAFLLSAFGLVVVVVGVILG